MSVGARGAPGEKIALVTSSMEGRRRKSHGNNGQEVLKSSTRRGLFKILAPRCKLHTQRASLRLYNLPLPEIYRFLWRKGDGYGSTHTHASRGSGGGGNKARANRSFGRHRPSKGRSFLPLFSLSPYRLILATKKGDEAALSLALACEGSTGRSSPCSVCVR